MNKVLKFMPCPAYDIERMESYLSDMAENGLYLTEDGFFCGFGCFQRDTPRPTRYRLAAAVKKRGFFDDNGGAPGDEEQETYQGCGWEYVAARGQFYIYCTKDSDALEPDTDKQVQSLAINLVRKREISNLLCNLFWFVFYPLIYFYAGLLRTALEIKTPLVLLLTITIVWTLLEGFRQIIHLRKLRRRLQNLEELTHDKDWREGAFSYRFGRIASVALDAVCILLLILSFGRSVSDTGKLPISEYHGELPFATMSDIAGNGSYLHTELLDYDTIRIDRDLLAPVMIEWHETGRWTDADGKSHSGGLAVDYYETSSPTLAKWLAWEFVRSDRRTKHYAAYDVRIDADYAFAYTAVFPTVVIQKGNKVIRATFYQTSDAQLAKEVWMNRIAESLQ